MWKTDTVPSFPDCGQKQSSVSLNNLWKLQSFCCGCHYVALRRDKPWCDAVKMCFYIHALIGDVLTEKRGVYDRVKVT